MLTDDLLSDCSAKQRKNGRMIPTLFSVSYAGLWGQHTLDLESFIRKAAALGYSAVELMAKRPHLSPLDFDSGKLDRIKQCAQENRIQIATIAPPSQTYFHPSNAAVPAGPADNSWGISVLPDDSNASLWHGFMTELEGGCALSSYSSASRVLHLTSSSPLGPFTVAGVALRSFAHNPQAVRDKDGSWLIFHIGNEVPLGCNATCSGGKPARVNATCSGASHGTSVARAATPWGPWERVNWILPDNETNPSAIVLPNGTIVVTARRWTGGVPIYTADSWRGPYTARPRAPAFPVQKPGAGVGQAVDGSFDEDPYFYTNEYGYHMLTHRQPSGTSCSATLNPDPVDCRCGGGHMFASDLAGPWFYNLDLPYNCSLSVEGVGGGVKLHARQRPTILFPSPKAKKSATTSCPILFTGASTDNTSQYYSSFTMAQEYACQ